MEDINATQSEQWINEETIMADKQVYIRDNGGGGLGLIAGILAVLLIGLGLLFATGGLKFDRDTNVKVEAPTAPQGPAGN